MRDLGGLDLQVGALAAGDVAPAAALGPRIQEQHQAEIALRTDRRLSSGVALVAPLLDMSTEQLQPIVIADSSRDRREYLGDEHIPVACRTQLADQPLELAADVVQLLAGYEFVVQREAGSEPAGRHPHLMDTFLVLAAEHATLVAAQMTDAGDHDLRQRFLRRRRRRERGKPRLSPGGLRLVRGPVVLVSGPIVREHGLSPCAGLATAPVSLRYSGLVPRLLKHARPV